MKSYKYDLIETNERTYNGTKLFRIVALKDFGDVKKNDMGGFVEGEWNLSQSGNCWIYGNAAVVRNGRVTKNAKLYNSSFVTDNSYVSDDAVLKNNAIVKDYGCVEGHTHLIDDMVMDGNMKTQGIIFVYKCVEPCKPITMTYHEDTGTMLKMDHFHGGEEEFLTYIRAAGYGVQVESEIKLIIGLVNRVAKKSKFIQQKGGQQC